MNVSTLEKATLLFNKNAKLKVFWPAHLIQIFSLALQKKIFSTELLTFLSFPMPAVSILLLLAGTAAQIHWGVNHETCASFRHDLQESICPLNQPAPEETLSQWFRVLIAVHCPAFLLCPVISSCFCALSPGAAGNSEQDFFTPSASMIETSISCSACWSHRAKLISFIIQGDMTRLTGDYPCTLHKWIVL